MSTFVHQLRFERMLFRRNPSAAFFNFVLPLLLLLLVATVFGDEIDLDLLIPGIAGMAIAATTFTALAYNVTFLREQGILKRVRGTPLPRHVYVGGLVGSAVVNAVAQIALVFAIGRIGYGVGLPDDLAAAAGFAVVGVAAFAALGVAFSHAIPNFDAAGAYTNAVFLPLIFISGVFYSADELPPVLEAVGVALPLKHVIDGLAGDGTLVGLAVVSGWGVLGAAMAVRHFRWE